MDYFDVDAISPRVIGAWVLILALGWYTLDQTKRWFFATVLTLGLLFAVARFSGVIDDHHIDKMNDAAGGKIDGATHRARLIGNKRHGTSAGGAGGTNKAYRKHIEGNPDLER